MNTTPEKIQRLQECVNVLDMAAAAAPVNRQSHVTAQTAIQELREHLALLSQPQVVPTGNPPQTGG